MSQEVGISFKSLSNYYSEKCDMAPFFAIGGERLNPLFLMCPDY